MKRINSCFICKTVNNLSKTLKTNKMKRNKNKIEKKNEEKIKVDKQKKKRKRFILHLMNN